MSIFSNYQHAHDIARFTMMIHDCVDACKHLANNVEPDNGDTPVPPIGYSGTQLEYLQSRIRSHSNAALINYSVLKDYVDKITLAVAKTSVSNVFGVEGDTIQTFIQELRDTAQFVYSNVLSATTLGELAPLATYIDNHVPQWKSIRRRWAI